MLTDFAGLCRDIADMSHDQHKKQVFSFAASKKSFLTGVIEAICHSFNCREFTLAQLLEFIKFDFAGLSPMDCMLISRCVKLTSELVSKKTCLIYAHRPEFSSRYYEVLSVPERA